MTTTTNIPASEIYGPHPLLQDHEFYGPYAPGFDDFAAAESFEITGGETWNLEHRDTIRMNLNTKVKVKIKAVKIKTDKRCCGFCHDKIDGEFVRCSGCGTELHEECKEELCYRRHTRGCSSVYDWIRVDPAKEAKEKKNNKRSNGDAVSLVLAGLEIREIAEIAKRAGSTCYYDCKMTSRKRWQDVDKIDNAVNRAEGIGWRYEGKANPGSARMSLGLMIRKYARMLDKEGYSQVSTWIEEIRKELREEGGY